MYSESSSCSLDYRASGLCDVTLNFRVQHTRVVDMLYRVIGTSVRGVNYPCPFFSYCRIMPVCMPQPVEKQLLQKWYS